VFFTATSLLLYREALQGPFIADDAAYITNNPYMHAPWQALLGELFNPKGDLRFYMMGILHPFTRWPISSSGGAGEIKPPVTTS
jgi:hypothetical protein